MGKVGTIDWVRTQIGEILRKGLKENDPWPWVREMTAGSSGTAIVDGVDGKMYEYPWSVDPNGEELLLGKPTEVTLEYVKKCMDESTATELTGPIVMKSAAKRIAYAAVLVPGEKDSDGETVTKSKIQDAAHEWMAEYGNVDLQHTLNNVARPVESFILPMDMTVDIAGKSVTLPEGSWILASKVTDDKTWEKVEKGELTGYSVMGIKRAALKSMTAEKSAETDGQVEAACKRTLLKDLGEDWVPAFVSIVDTPAVPKAKFFALKSIDEAPEPEPTPSGIKAWIANALGLGAAEKAGRKFSDGTYQHMKTMMESMTTLSTSLSALMAEADKERGDKSEKSKGDEDMTPEEIKAVVAEALKSGIAEQVDAAVKAAIEPVSQKVDAIEAASKAKADEAPANTQKQEETKEPETEVTDAVIKSKLDEIKGLLEQRFVKKSAPASKSLTAEDEANAATKSQEVPGRDSFGRRVR